jgi:hypothetical protein
MLMLTETGRRVAEAHAQEIRKLYEWLEGNGKIPLNCGVNLQEGDPPRHTLFLQNKRYRGIRVARLVESELWWVTEPTNNFYPPYERSFICKASSSEKLGDDDRGWSRIALKHPTETDLDQLSNAGLVAEVVIKKTILPYLDRLAGTLYAKLVAECEGDDGGWPGKHARAEQVARDLINTHCAIGNLKKSPFWTAE